MRSLLPFILDDRSQVEHTIEGDPDILSSFSLYLRREIEQRGNYELRSEMRDGSLIVSVPDSDAVRRNLLELWNKYQQCVREGYIELGSEKA